MAENGSEPGAVKIGISLSPSLNDLLREAAKYYGVGVSELLRTAFLEKLTREGLLEKLKAGQGRSS